MRRLRWLAVGLSLALVVAACGRDDEPDAAPTTTQAPPAANTGASGTGDTGGPTTTAAVDPCEAEPLEATEVGVTADTITITVMADTGSPLAPGLFQGNVDAINAYAKYVNANGGIGCRDLVVREWDSKLDATESKNGLIDACVNSLAMVGGNALFNPDVSPMTNCVDKEGAATGLPDIAALANDIHEQCAPTTFVIQAVAEECKVLEGSRNFAVMVGPTQYYEENFGPGLHGLFLVPGDLPTTRQSATYQIAGQEGAGITWDNLTAASGRDEQAAYTPKVQALKASGGTYAYNGSNDKAMWSMRKEAKAQGLDSVKVWGCSLSCYTPAFLATGGADVEGTYAWMQFLPFEEADSNPAAKAYVDAIKADGKNVDSFGAQAWQGGMLFRQVVDEIVEADGPNAITRAKILEVLAKTDDFDADGWAGVKPLKGISPCIVILQVKGGKFERVHPAEKGTFDCDADNVVTVTLDPVAEAAKIQ